MRCPPSSPPITARASTAFCSSPGPPIAIGSMPTIIAPAVMRTGRSRVLPASTQPARDAFVLHALAREGHEQDRIRGRNANRHDRAHQRWDAQGSARDKQHHHNAAAGAGKAQYDGERVDEILKIHHHQKINEHRRKHEPDAEAVEGRLHALRLPGKRKRVARLELASELSEYLVDLSGHAAKVAIGDARIDIVHRSYVVRG